MARKYSYTYAPKRKRASRSLGLRSSLPGISLASPMMFAGPVVLVISVVLLSRAFGGGAAPASSNDDGCPGGQDCPAVLSASETPEPLATVVPTAAPAPTPLPVEVSEEELPLPSIEGRAFAVLEPACGALLQERNGNVTLPPASLTKIVTALVVVDHAGLDELVTIDIDGGALSLETDATVMGVRPGDPLTVRDLLYGLLMRSGNDAALELAEHISGDEESFTELMNEKVSQLRLVDSHFTNAHGLHDFRLYSSALDMTSLGAALLASPALAEIVGTKAYQPNWDREAIDNMNLLLNNYPGTIGIKTGFTDVADQTIVAAAERGGRTIIVSIFGTGFMYEEAVALLDWAFSTESPCV